MFDADRVAQEIMDAWAARRQIPSLAARLPGFDLDQAYQVTAALRRIRQQRGERPVGRKIGFTNRTIWDEYQVYAPIWGDMYATTLQETDGHAHLDLSSYLEPRIEPEIAFGLARAPEPGMGEAALLGCIAWVAHGFEIVHSMFEGWRFAAADTVAAFALHGAYRLGPRRHSGIHLPPGLQEVKVDWAEAPPQVLGRLPGGEFQLHPGVLASA